MTVADDLTSMTTPPALFQLVIDALPQSVFWKDRNLVFRGCNVGFAQDAGRATPEEIIGKTDYDMAWKAQAELYRSDDQLVMDSNTPRLDYEEPLPQPDGSVSWIRTSKLPLHGPDGSVVGVLGMFENITTSKRNELALAHDRSLLEAALESTADGIVVVDNDGRIAVANRRFADMWRITGETLASSSFAVVMESVRERLADPAGFIASTRAFLERPDAEGSDIIALTDGRTFERVMRPQRLGSTIVGRVFSFRDITERVRAEATMRESELKYRTLVNNMLDGMFMIAGGRFIFANQAFCDMLGYTPNELAGLAYLDVVAPKNRDLIRERYMRRLTGKDGPREYECQLLHKDGTTRVDATIATQVITYEGQVVTLGAAKDITERKRHESELRASEERLHAISESTPIPIAITKEADGTILFANQRFCETFGVPREACLGRTFADFYPDPAERQKMLATLHAHGRLRDYEIRFKKPDGARLLMAMSIEPMKLDGTPSLLATFFDLTERERHAAALRASEERFRAISTATPVSIGISSATDGRVFYVNERFCETFGLPYDTIIGRKAVEFYLDASERARLLAALEEHRSLRDFEVWMRRGDGSPLLMSMCAEQLMLDSQEAILIALVDLTERQRAEQERARLQEEIIQAQEATLRELSTPLIPFSNEVVGMPLIGSIDSRRAQQVLETLLEGIAGSRAEIAILDITGVPVVDTQVANALVRAAQAARLLGAQIILTGIRPEVAQTLVGLGVDLTGIITCGTLQSGIATALGRSASNARSRVKL